jgi:hypothetical protein
MKNFKLYSCAAVIAASSLFTSCMEQNNKRSGATFAVITTMENPPYDNFAQTSVGAMTSESPKFVSASSGECCLFSYDIDFDNQPVGQPAGYVNAVVSGYEIIDQSYASSSTDNDSIYVPSTNEIPFSGVVPQAFIDDKLFIGSQFKEEKGQINNYQLLYNVDSTYTENDQKVYKVYFTGTRDKSGTADNLNVEYTAFDISTLVQEAKRGATGEIAYLNLEIKYIKTITKKDDKTTLEWVKTDDVKIAIPLDQTDK